MLIHCPMDEKERQHGSDLRQSRTTAKISASGNLEQREKIRIPPSVSKPVKRKRVDVGGKMYEDELMVLNVRLKRYGYESAITLLRDFKDGVFPEDYFKPQGAISMGENQSNSGAVSLIDGKPNPDFFNHIDYEKMFEFYRNELKLSERYARSCCNYFKYNWRVFFGDHPEELQKFTVDQRQWIVLSFRNFAKYYLRLTGSDEVEEAVRLTIKRYSLNVGLGFENRLILVDEGYISRMSKAVVERVKGELGTISQMGLLAGTREDELVYMFNTPVCDKGSICDAEKCKNLHLINKKNGMTIVVVNWHRRGKHCYFTIIPTMLWQAFKALPKFSYNDIRPTHLYLKSRLDLKFMYLRKLHYNVMLRTLGKDAAEVLAGRANTVSARHYLMVEVDRLTEQVIDAWSNFGVRIER
jgi:intergrase/recombinase